MTEPLHEWFKFDAERHLLPGTLWQFQSESGSDRESATRGTKNKPPTISVDAICITYRLWFPVCENTSRCTHYPACGSKVKAFLSYVIVTCSSCPFAPYILFLHSSSEEVMLHIPSVRSFTISFLIRSLFRFSVTSYAASSHGKVCCAILHLAQSTNCLALPSSSILQVKACLK